MKLTNDAVSQCKIENCAYHSHHEPSISFENYFNALKVHVFVMCQGLKK